MEHEGNRAGIVEFLETLSANEDRQALAILRRGLDGSPRARLEMYPYVIKFLRDGATKWEEEVLLTIASLYSLHPSTGGTGDMGSVMNEIHRITGSNSVEGRFMALLRVPGENVPDHLKHCVSLAKSKEVAIDWHRLYEDLLRWNNEGMIVQKRWAASYWSDQTGKTE